MRRYRFSVVSLGELLAQTPLREAGAFDRRANRKEITIALRRDLICEVCGEPFDTTFSVVTHSVAGRGGRTVDSDTVRAELERQLRRRVRCPFCHAVQRGDRRSFLRRERRHSLIGIAAVSGTIVGTSMLSGGGYLLAGTWGLMLGLGGSFVLTWTLTRWMLAQLLAPLSSP